MSPRTEIIYLLSRIELQQERTVEILLGLQTRLQELGRPMPSERPPPRWNHLATPDVIKLATAAVFLWLALTGRLTPADIVGLLR